MSVVQVHEQASERVCVVYSPFSHDASLHQQFYTLIRPFCIKAHGSIKVAQNGTSPNFSVGVEQMSAES